MSTSRPAERLAASIRLALSHGAPEAAREALGSLVRPRSRRRSAALEEYRRMPISDPARVAGWKDVPIAGSVTSERLVPLGPFSSLFPGFAGFETAASQAVYFQERSSIACFLGAPVDRRYSLLGAYVREGLIPSLRAAARTLGEEGLHLLFLDCFRPLVVQQCLFDGFLERLAQERGEPPERLLEEAQTYVSLPAPGPGRTHASPHSTGAAIDLTLLRLDPVGDALLDLLEESRSEGVLAELGEEAIPGEATLAAALAEEIAIRGGECDPVRLARIFRELWRPRLGYELGRALILHNFGRQLEMGTEFDYFGREAGTAHFEELLGQDARLAGSGEEIVNRRILFHALEAAGFANYEEEWWHYSSGDGMWAAKRRAAEARYHLAEFGGEHQEFEVLRRIARRIFSGVWG